MEIGETEDRLRAMLADAGLLPPAKRGLLGRRRDQDGGPPLGEDVVPRTWEVVQRFAALPVEGVSAEDDSDGMLFQTGVYDWYDGRGPHFAFSVVRQFSLDDEDGEYDGMLQLECLLEFAPAPDLQALPRAELWSFGMSLEEWAAQAEALPGFAGAAAHPERPLALRVTLEEV